MTHIRVNGQWVDWPKATISGDVIRSYADASPEDTITQQHEHAPRAQQVTAVADLRDGTIFTTTPKEQDHG